MQVYSMLLEKRDIYIYIYYLFCSFLNQRVYIKENLVSILFHSLYEYYLKENLYVLY